MVVKSSVVILIGLLAVSFAACSNSQASDVPANGRIAFLMADDYVGQIYTVNPDGSDMRRLTNDGYDHVYVSWSPNGERILFLRLKYDPVGRFRPSDYTPGPYDDGGEGLFVMDSDGTNVSRLVAGAKVGDPQWSPDGNSIAYTWGSTIYLINTDGNNLQVLVDDARYSSNIAWSPDSTEIAFVKEHDNVQDIFAVNVDNQSVRQLTRAPREYMEVHSVAPSLEWSSDGSEIAFLAGNDVLHADVYAVAADGGGQQRLTHDLGFKAWPSWSPDGSHLAYVKGNEGLILMRSDGTHAVNLSPEIGQPIWLLWSPDGSQILFASGTDLYLVDADGGTPQPFSNPEIGTRIEDWQPLWQQ